MENLIAKFDGFMDGFKAAISAALNPTKQFLDIFSDFWVGATLILIVFAVLLIFTALKYGKEFSPIIKKPQTLAICAMLVALNIILGYFTLNFTSYLRVGFGFITLPVVTALFGPLVGCVMGIAQDVLSFIIKPTGGYLFTLTLNVGISGMIYGLMLYKKKLTFLRVFLVKVVIVLFVNIILNSIGLAPTVGSGIVGILPSRIIKNLLLVPIQAVIVYAILKTVKARVKTRT